MHAESNVMIQCHVQSYIDNMMYHAIKLHRLIIVYLYIRESIIQCHIDTSIEHSSPLTRSDGQTKQVRVHFHSEILCATMIFKISINTSILID